MPQRSKFIVQIADPILALFSLFVAYLLIWGANPYFNHAPFATRRSLQDVFLVVVLAVFWHWLFSIAGIYRPRLLSFFKLNAGELLRAAALFPLPVVAFWFITRDERRSSLAQAVAISCLGAVVLPFCMVALRLGCTFFKRYLWYGNTQLRQVLVVGTNPRALKFVTESMRNPDAGFTCVGFVDDGWFGNVAREESPLTLDGTIEELPALLRLKPIDEVVIALPMASYYTRAAEIVSLCQTHGIRARIIGQLFETNMTRPQLAESDASPVLTIHEPAWSEFSSFTKRLLDVAVSATLLLICLPVFVAAAIAIAATSEGPVFFRQTRLGLGKRRFKIFKFRTMVSNASELVKQLEHLNETGGPTFKLKNDPRITKVGAFLRKTSIDELPQLINVLIGDMSLVGPRPLPLRDYEGFSDDNHRRRFSVKPGITCLWQVMGRSSIKFEQWMALDSQYIDQRTFWLDLKILLQTVPAVLRGSGAV